MVVDVGVDADFDGVTGLVHRKVRRGTRNFAREAAMTETRTERRACRSGSTLRREANAQGRTLIALGEMGIGNTSAATAITAALTGEPVSDLTGRGTGLDERTTRAQGPDHRQGAAPALRRLTRFAKPEPLETTALRRRAWRSRPSPARSLVPQPIASPVVIDGFICTAGAAVACAHRARRPLRHHRRPSVAGTGTPRPAGDAWA